MRLAIYTGIILTSGLVCLNSASAADPTGDWRVADGAANIRIAQCNGSMWGVVAWEKTPGRDEKNPDVSKRTRPTLGMPILIDMKKKPDHDQWEGQVYDAEDGRLYSSTITPISADQLEIKGCALGIFCGGETWTRVAPPIPSHDAAKAAPKAKSAAPSTAAAKTAATTPAAAKPGAAPVPAGAPKSTGATTDRVGDICLLPDVAGASH